MNQKKTNVPPTIVEDDREEVEDDKGSDDVSEDVERVVSIELDDVPGGGEDVEDVDVGLGSELVVEVGGVSVSVGIGIELLLGGEDVDDGSSDVVELSVGAGVLSLALVVELLSARFASSTMELARAASAWCTALTA